MRTLIAVPSMDEVRARFAQSLAMLRKTTGDIGITFQVGSLVYISRNELAHKAFEFSADYVLWLDSDMVFDPDLLERLMERMNDDKIDIISGVYYRRTPPFSPVLYKNLTIDKDGRCQWEEYTDLPDELFEAAGIGFGCVLMRTSVLMNVFAKYLDMFTPLPGAGEDLSFCWRARECGYKIHVDPAIQCGHVAKTVVDQNFYKAYKGG